MKVTSINQNGKEKTLDSNKNVNQELQSLVDDGSSFNENTNWLVYNDNGTEKLVSKKSLKYSIAWNSLYNAGVVFGEDGVKDLENADFSDEAYDGSSYTESKLKDYGKGKGTPKAYKSTYVAINNKKYVVRLIRAYDDNTFVNDRSSTFGQYDRVKGSEWNRLILPLIEDKIDGNRVKGGRYGYYTDDLVEGNMLTLAYYSWWTDFGSLNDSLGNYSKESSYASRWTQETGYNGNKCRTYRGNNADYRGAADVDNYYPNDNYNTFAWLPVLERVDK